MKVVKLGIDSIKPYERNAKRHPEAQIDDLARAIREDGWTQPLVVDANHVLVVGHGRLAAAKKLGLSHVPVVVLPADIPEERIRAMRLFDNKVAETGWDKEILAQEFASFDDGFDYSMTGFDSKEIERITKALEPDVPPTDFKDVTFVATDHRCPKCGYEF